MSDTWDVTAGDLPADQTSPYGTGPFHIAGKMFLVRRDDASGLYLCSLMARDQVGMRRIKWTRNQPDAKRFLDTRIAGEFVKFIDLQPFHPKFSSVIVMVDEENPPGPQTRRWRPTTQDEALTAREYLTTYTGFAGRRKTAAAGKN